MYTHHIAKPSASRPQTEAQQTLLRATGGHYLWLYRLTIIIITQHCRRSLQEEQVTVGASVATENNTECKYL